MSLEAISWAISVRDRPGRRITAAQKAVLLVLANRADAAGVCWPSVGTVAEEACLSERGARDAMRHLEAVGLAKIIERGGGRHRSATYRLSVDEPETRQEVPGNDEPETEETRQMDADTRQEMPGNQEPIKMETRQMLPERGQMVPETRQMLPERGQHLPPNPKNPKEPSRKPKPRASGAGDHSGIDLPTWLSREAWAEWCVHRLKKDHRGWTDGAATHSLRELGKLRGHGHDPTAVIHQSIQRGWTGLFPLRADFGRLGSNQAEARRSAADLMATLYPDAGFGDPITSQQPRVIDGECE